MWTSEPKPWRSQQNHLTGINMNRIEEIIAELYIISERQTEKTVTMWIQPIDEGWSCEFDFSNEELNLTNDLTEELNGLMNFRVSFPLFAYKAK